MTLRSSTSRCARVLAAAFAAAAVAAAVPTAVVVASTPAGGTVSTAPLRLAPGDVWVGECSDATRTYETIQEAVDAARDGRTIWVCPGTYPESVHLSGRNELTIRPVPRSELRPGVRVPAPPVVDPPGTDDDGFVITDGKGNTVRGLRVTDAFTGVNVINAVQTSVSDVLVTDVRYGISIDTASTRSKARRNVVRRASELGIGFSFGSRGVLDANRVSASGTGILLLSTVDTEVSGNRVRGASGTGLEVAGSRDADLSANRADGALLDVSDDSSGSGTAGTANLWRATNCETSDPDGLCDAR